MRRLTLLLVALLAMTAVAAPALASGTRINVPRKFKKILPSVRASSGIAVRLPSYLDVGIRPKRVHGTLEDASKGDYGLDLGVGKNCDGADACFVASFSGEKHGKFHGGKKVSLAHGIKGRFHDISCGASCSPASIEWKQKHVLYDIQVKAGKAKLKRLANQAIKAGPR